MVADPGPRGPLGCAFALNLSGTLKCTVVIEGIPGHIDERDLTIQLLTALGAQGWDVGNKRVIARNWMRELNRNCSQSSNRRFFTGRGRTE